MTNHKIEEVIKLYNTRINGVIKRFFRTDNDIDDIKQEVYIKTWKNLSKYRGDSSLWAWINKITLNACKDHARSSKNKHLIQESDDSLYEVRDHRPLPEKKAIISERQKQILNAIDKLKPKLKEVVLLYDIDELTYEEISEKIKCPVGTVKSRLFNARKVLKEELHELLE